MRYDELRCIKCGRDFEYAFAGTEERNYPNLVDGLVFRSAGAYGSDYDPVHDGYLCIAVCDACLWAMGNSGNVIQAVPPQRPVRPPDPELARWDPDESQGL